MTTPSPSDPTGATLENLSYESRSFPPSAEFAAQANVMDEWRKQIQRHLRLEQRAYANAMHAPFAC